MIRQFISAALLGGMSFAAQAQPPGIADWPAKPVRVIVPYSPGGTSDTLGRLISQHLQSFYKQGFVVENRSGGAGTIGAAQASKFPPDGYTLVVSGIGSHVIAPVAIKAFNPMADFTHIAMLGGPPLVLAVHSSVPANNLKELIAYVKGTKEGLSWGSPGQGTHGYLIGELFARQAKIQQTHISYKGAAPAVADLMGGQIPAVFVTFSTASAAIKSGKVRALAITGSRRLPDMPAVPTFAELGYPELTSTTWFSLSGPPGMPAELVDRINAEVRRGLKTEAAQKQLAFEGIETQDWDAATFTRYMRSEIDRWEPLARSVDRARTR